MNSRESVEYLVAKHLLKQLLAKGMISQEEFNRIDELCQAWHNSSYEK